MAGAQSAFRQVTGVAKDTINGNLAPSSGSYPVGTTSIILTNVVGSPANLMTMTIFDGINSEQVAVSAYNSGTKTVTCAATTIAHSANIYASFQLTASAGPTALLRLMKSEFDDDYDNKLYDTGYRGSQAAQFGAQQGMRVAGISLEGALFPDEFGWMCGSFFGAYDYSATSGSNPTTYAFSPQNAGNGQPTPYIFYFYNPGDNTVSMYAKAVISDLEVTFDPAALAKWTASGMSFVRAVVAAPTLTNLLGVGFSAFKPLPSRDGLVTIGGTVNGLAALATYSFKREEFGPIYTLQGIQDPLALFSGPVSLNVKTTVVMADDVIYNDYINLTQPTWDILATTAVGGVIATTTTGIEIHCNQANLEDIKVTTKGAYQVLDGSFTALANTTDATTAGTGYSPSKVTISVGTNTGSTLY